MSGFLRDFACALGAVLKNHRDDFFFIVIWCQYASANLDGHFIGDGAGVLIDVGKPLEEVLLAGDDDEVVSRGTEDPGIREVLLKGCGDGLQKAIASLEAEHIVVAAHTNDVGIDDRWPFAAFFDDLISLWESGTVIGKVRKTCKGVVETGVILRRLNNDDFPAHPGGDGAADDIFPAGIVGGDDVAFLRYFFD